MENEMMAPEHPDWEAFLELLEGPEGCDFHEDPVAGATWKCSGSGFALATQILERHFPEVDLAETLAYFETCGAFCDCEILFNVAYV